MLAIAPELTMADHRAQSDEIDIVSIDSDCAEPGAADATGVVCPLRVKSVSESKRMRRTLAPLASDALRLGLRLLGGCRRACSPKRGYRNRPVGSAEAGPSIYCRTLDRGL
jgi:hypothetical protein